MRGGDVDQKAIDEEVRLLKLYSRFVELIKYVDHQLINTNTHINDINDFQRNMFVDFSIFEMKHLNDILCLIQPKYMSYMDENDTDY